MTHHLLITLVRGILHALLVHGCCEAFRVFLDHLAPDIPPFVCIAFAFALGVTLVEVAGTLWHRRGPPDLDQ